MLANTDLSTDWAIVYPTSAPPAGTGFSNGQYCFMASTGGYGFVLGYPNGGSAQPFSLTAGASYTFSYELSGSGVAATGLGECSTVPQFEAKIGLSAAPNTTQIDWCDTVPSATTTITHTFTPDAANPLTGLGIGLEGNLNAGGQICIANVQLVQNP